MGGEREDHIEASKPARPPSGGGQQPTEVESAVGRRLRIHENAGEVHFHDDNAQPRLKVAVPVAEWWKAWERLRVPGIEPQRFVYVDVVNSSVLKVETVTVIAEFRVESYVTIEPIVVGDTFKKLQQFTKRK